MGDVSTEIWRNDSEGIVQVKKAGANGRLEPVLVQPGRTFDMTTDERKLNQMEIATATDDPWTNKLFSRVGAIDSIVESDPAREVASTPDRVSFADLFSLGLPDLRAQVADITNPTTLRAMYESGVESGAKPAKIQVVADRVREIDADADYLPAPAPTLTTGPATTAPAPFRSEVTSTTRTASNGSDDSDAKPKPAPAGTRPARP